MIGISNLGEHRQANKNSMKELELFLNSNTTTPNQTGNKITSRLRLQAETYRKIFQLRGGLVTNTIKYEDRNQITII